MAEAVLVSNICRRLEKHSSPFDALHFVLSREPLKLSSIQEIGAKVVRLKPGPLVVPLALSRDLTSTTHFEDFPPRAVRVYLAKCFKLLLSFVVRSCTSSRKSVIFEF